MLTKLKEDQKTFRLKYRDTKDMKYQTCNLILATLIGEIDTKSKNVSRALTNEEIVALIKKFIKGIEESLVIRQNDTLVIQKELLENYLPQQLSETNLRSVILTIVAKQDKPNVGLVMKTLKEEYCGMFDGAAANKIAKEIIS